LALALAGAGCASGFDDGFAVDLTVDARALAGDARATVRTLAFAVSNGDRPQVTVRGLHTEERVIYRPLPSESGSLVFVLTVSDGAGRLLARGETTAWLSPPDTTTATLILRAPTPAASSDGAATPSDGGSEAPDLAPACRSSADCARGQVCGVFVSGSCEACRTDYAC